MAKLTWIGLVVLACGSAEPTIPDEPISETAFIAAASGGVLELDDGMRIQIAPGGLDRDAEVTLSRIVCSGVFASSSFASCVYQVDGGGALPTERLSLSLPTKESASANEACAVGESVSGWRCLADSRASASSIEATAGSFVNFAARAVSATPGDARVADVDFTSCGGELDGRWTLVKSTGSVAQISGIRRSGGEDPYAACEPNQHYEDKPLTFRGAITFTLNTTPSTDGSIGSYERSHSANVRRHTISTLNCLATAGGTCQAEYCTREANLCECTWLDSDGSGVGAGSFAYGAVGEVSFDGNVHRYCVQGDQLTLEMADQDGVYLMLYEREG